MNITKKVFRMFFSCGLCYENYFFQAAWKFIYHGLIPSRGGIMEVHICIYCARNKNNAIKKVIEKYEKKGIFNWVN